MFNVIRPTEVPSCLSKNQYNDQEVVLILNSIFHGKCYLCENNSLLDPEIEHLDPHEGDIIKKYNWQNLFYSCGRCNSIKGSAHKEILNCCDENIDVFRAIKYTLPSVPDAPISIEAVDPSPSSMVLNTVQLLDRCYNEDNTPLRSVTRVELIEKIFFYYTEYLKLRATLRDLMSGSGEKTLAKERLLAMLKIEFPFSCIWRWNVLRDSFLIKELNGDLNF